VSEPWKTSRVAGLRGYLAAFDDVASDSRGCCWSCAAVGWPMTPQQVAEALEVYKVQRFGSARFIENPSCDEMGRCQLHSIPVNRCIECWPAYLKRRLSVIVSNFHLERTFDRFQPLNA
jgi:hypothetical protein